MKTSSGFVALTLALVLGCAGSMSREESWAQAQGEMMDNITNRVTFETGCAADQIRATYLDSGTVGVEACGQRLVYIIVPSQSPAPCSDPYDSATYKPHKWYMKYCKAVLNSDTQAAPGASEAPAATPAPAASEAPAAPPPPEPAPE